MSHIRQGLHRIRSRCHQLKIEYYHRKYNNNNNNNNNDGDFSRVVPKRGANISSWSLKTSFNENDMDDDDDDGLIIDGDYIQGASLEQQQQQQGEFFLNADDETPFVTVLNHQRSNSDDQEEDDNFTLFDENEFYHCNCQGKENELQSGVSLITNDLRTEFTSNVNSNALIYNDDNDNVVVNSTAVADVNDVNSNHGKSDDANHSNLFKQYFGSKFDLLHKSIVSLPYTIFECNSVTYQDYKQSYVDIVEPPLPHLYFNNEENLMFPLENAAPIYFDRETPFTPWEFRKIINVVELNKNHYAALALLGNCQCAPCQSHYTWKLLDDNCTLIRALWDNDVGLAKPFIEDISHCNYWKGPTPSSNSTIPSKIEADENSIDTRFKSFKLSRRKSNGNRLLHSRNRLLSTNAAIKNSFKSSSKRKSIENSNNLLDIFDKGYKCETKPTFKIDGSHKPVEVELNLFPDIYPCTPEYQQQMDDLMNDLGQRSLTLEISKENENSPFNSGPSTIGDLNHESHQQILSSAIAETHTIDQLVIYNSITPLIPSAVASIKSTFASLNKFGF